MNSQELVRNYFDREAERFDTIYEERKPWLERWVDRTFRRVIIARFHLICNLAPTAGAWTVLDVGCGPGRYAVALAKQGAAAVCGVDGAPGMIQIAERQSQALGVSSRCRFIVSSFLDAANLEPADVVVATGYFDYLREPLPELKKMLSLCRGRLFASFPKRFEFRVPLRKFRFLLEHGFVRFYSKRQIEALFAYAGVPADRVSMIDLGRDWIIVARPAGPQS